jgi:hypothetical protein
VTAEQPIGAEVQPRWAMYVTAFAAVVLLAIVVYAWGDWMMLAVSALVAGAAWFAGGFLGFLFGIPRSLAQQTSETTSGSDPRYSPNTNLEQISDWLTKILVGVGLVQFTTFATRAGDLVHFLGPALGGGALGEAFAGGLLVFCSVGGFLSFYLITRIYLPRAFAQADRDTLAKAVQVEVARVQKTQEQSDLEALSLAARQLEPEPGAPSVSQSDLDAAFARASPVVKSQLFFRARDQRSKTWNSDKKTMERTIPVFRALIASEGDRPFHRNHGQLGYALRDQTQPDLQEADDELTKAIQLRDTAGAGGFLLYEFNRALTRISRYGPNPPAAVRVQIETDLAAAGRSPHLARQIAGDQEIGAFRGGAPSSAADPPPTENQAAPPPENPPPSEGPDGQ